MGVVGYRFHHQVMRHAVKEGSDVKIEHPILLPTASTGHSQRLMGTSPRAIAVTVWMKDRLKPLLQPRRHRGLSYSVGRGWHPEHPDPSPMILRYLHRPHRRRHVAARAHPTPQLVEQVALVAFKVGDALTVHARRSTIGPDLLPRLKHETFGDFKRPSLRPCSTHQLLPNQRVGL